MTSTAAVRACVPGGEPCLVPINPTGRVVDLLEAVHEALELPRGPDHYDAVLDPGGPIAADAALGDVGVAGLEEMVEVRLKPKYMALAALGAEPVRDPMAAFWNALNDPTEEAVALAQLVVTAELLPAETVVAALHHQIERWVNVGNVDGVLASIDVATQYVCDEASVLNCRSDGLGWTLLHCAAARGDAAVARALLSRGAAVDVCCHQGTALAVAADAEVASVLLDAGADVASRDQYQHYTPLHVAVTQGRRDVVEVLLAGGAQPGAVECVLQQTPVMLAAKGNHLAIMRLLIQRADAAVLDASDAGGGTALHWAARRGHADMARLLIQSGAAADLRDNRGQKPFAHLPQLQYEFERGR